MPTLFLADINLFQLIPLVAIIGSLVIGPLIIYIVFRATQRRHELWHETARVALEKGQPPPPLPAEMTAAPEPAKPANDIRSGLILMAVGAGLYLFLNALLGRAMGLVGAIPGFIGLAMFGFGVVTAAFKRKETPPTDRP